MRRHADVMIAMAQRHYDTVVETFKPSAGNAFSLDLWFT